MHAHRKRLERHAKTSSLEQLLGTRPSRESLRQFGIIAEDDDKIAEEEATAPFVLSPLNITPDLILPAAAASTLPAPDTTCVVFLWGQGHHGQLGLDNTRSQPFPQLVRSLLGVRVAQVALGAQHSLCVTSDGLAYGWGSNQHGQLGLGPDLALVKSPETLHVSRSPICNTTVQRVAAGAAHSAIVTGARRVLVMGRGQTPAQDDLLTFPAAVKPLADVDVDAVACGQRSSSSVQRSLTRAATHTHRTAALAGGDVVRRPVGLGARRRGPAGPRRRRDAGGRLGAADAHDVARRVLGVGAMRAGPLLRHRVRRRRLRLGRQHVRAVRSGVPDDDVGGGAHPGPLPATQGRHERVVRAAPHGGADRRRHHLLDAHRPAWPGVPAHPARPLLHGRGGHADEHDRWGRPRSHVCLRPMAGAERCSSCQV